MNHPSHETIAAFASGDHHVALDRAAIRLEILGEREAEARADLERAIDARIAERRGTGTAALAVAEG